MVFLVALIPDFDASNHRELFQAAGAAVGAGMGILGVAGHLGLPILKALMGCKV